MWTLATFLCSIYDFGSQFSLILEMKENVTLWKEGRKTVTVKEYVHPSNSITNNSGHCLEAHDFIQNRIIGGKLIIFLYCFQCLNPKQRGKRISVEFSHVFPFSDSIKENTPTCKFSVFPYSLKHFYKSVGQCLLSL